MLPHLPHPLGLVDKNMAGTVLTANLPTTIRRRMEIDMGQLVNHAGPIGRGQCRGARQRSRRTKGAAIERAKSTSTPAVLETFAGP